MFAYYVKALLLGVLASYLLVAFYWTLTGHCCGGPLITEWDSCLPVQGHMWPEVWFESGHCDYETWQRVPGSYAVVPGSYAGPF